jgi:Peptidase family M1 domain
MRRWLLGLLVFLGCALRSQAADWTPERWFEKANSPRIANYKIQAALDWQAKTLEGSETISWRNAGSKATDEFPLHLYLNAFKGPQTIFMRESGGQLRGDKSSDPSDASSWGYCRLVAARMEGKDLIGHYGEDESVYWLRLPRMVNPGETIEVQIEWQNRYPKVFARSGWEGNFLMSAQWFPKVGVYQNDTWNCHAYHANTEFFSDFGAYDVELSLPNALLLAHTGTQVNFTNAADVQKDPKRPLNVIWKLHAEDVHDFAWAVKPKAAWNWKRFDYRKIQVFYYYETENAPNLDRQKRAVENALRHGEEMFFKYPYPTLTVIDTPKTAPGADGMEYPTLITAKSVGFDPFEQRLEPEAVSVHEFGHQYFYGLLASNEFEEPWLDEGFNSWFTHKSMERGYHALLSSRRFHVPTDFGEWLGYWDDPSVDPLTVFGWKVRDQGSYFRTAYAKPTMVLNQLEAMLGRPVMDEVMRAYTNEMKFKHPTRADFKRIAERVSKRDLSAFWRDFVEGTEVFDIAIRSVRSFETQQGGWMDGPKGPEFASPQSVSPGATSRIMLVRRGGIVMPITLWVRLENREERRVVWDARERWVSFDFESPITAAVLDPDGNYPMLKDRLHASYTTKPARRGFQYWSHLVWGSVTGLLQSAGLG